MQNNNEHPLFQRKAFPWAIQLALTPVCNSRCVFCPQDKIKGKKILYFPKELLQKLLDELVSRNWRGKFIISGFGEPTMHPEFDSFFQMIRFSLDTKASIMLGTNMSLITEERAKMLLSCGLNELHFNLDGASKEQYEETKCGLNFETICNNILKFLELNGEEDCPTKVICNVLSKNRYWHEAYGEEWNPEDDTWKVIERMNTYPNVFVQIPGVGFWQTPKNEREEKTDWCVGILSREMFYQINIDQEGIVFPCCQDYHTQISFGNFNEQTVEEIWNGEKRLKFIELLFNRQYKEIGDPCLHCRSPQPNR